jgi:type I restriction enzyme S subunit
MAVENNITSLQGSHCEERSKLKQSVSLIPKLRFKEFEGEWKKKKLRNVSNFLDSKRIPLSQTERKTKKGKYPYYGASGVIDFIDDYIFNGEYILLGEDGANILMRNSPLAFLASGKFWVNNHAHVILANDSNKFLAESLERIKYDKYNTGTAQPKLNSEVCKNILINLPKLPEQQKIATFLTSVDTKIQQLTTKKQLLENYKKGIMQQLFSQQLRFKNEDSLDFPDWEEKKLGKICISIKSGKSKSIEGGDFPLYGSTGIIGVCENFSHDGLFILIARVGANAGTINIINDKFGVSDNTLVLDCNQNTFLHFIYYFLDFYNLNRLVFGSGQPLLTGGQLKSLKLNLPSLKEQQKIANYLIAIDTKIENVQSQIEKTQAFKKGLLQQMFV